MFDIDLEHCPQCGGDFKIIAAIEEPAVIVRILTHLGLPLARAAALPGAACVSVPDGLILKPIAVAQRRRRSGSASRSREAIRLCRSEAIRTDEGLE